MKSTQLWVHTASCTGIATTSAAINFWRCSCGCRCANGMHAGVVDGFYPIIVSGSLDPWILGFSESSYRLVCFRLEVQVGFVLAYKIKSLARWNWRRRTIRTHACICLQCKHRILAGLCTSGSSNCSVVGESLPGLSLKPRRKILVNSGACCCCKCQSFGVIISLARLPLHARSWPSRRWRKSGNRCLRRAIAMPVIE